jgi:hypothetical protein
VRLQLQPRDWAVQSFLSPYFNQSLHIRSLVVAHKLNQRLCHYQDKVDSLSANNRGDLGSAHSAPMGSPRERHCSFLNREEQPKESKASAFTLIHNVRQRPSLIGLLLTLTPTDSTVAVRRQKGSVPVVKSPGARWKAAHTIVDYFG